MFLKKIFCIAVLVTMAYGDDSVSKPNGYILENLKHLQSLVQKKKTTKAVLPLDVLFDGYVDDTKKLIEGLEQERACEQQGTKKEETLKQIAHYMAVLEKLLTIMNSNQPEPLKLYCHQHRSDALWGSLCGDRPAAKHVFKPDEPAKKPDPQQSSQQVKLHCDDENLESAMGG